MFVVVVVGWFVDRVNANSSPNSNYQPLLDFQVPAGRCSEKARGKKQEVGSKKQQARKQSDKVKVTVVIKKGVSANR
ncbi:predicted protein [Sclerotinia sclerotiorum 1980 UF-70]|uniref:Uncharacterized protein n=1 Tax=Sclerotinia sclerotiorum (strain ATCC 18683 / 1980 / Ss-1) TaxID=665079 RepID=A7EE67_SCLS1|nr:predicted protein [Sclerotinia sclerotiorum 1980 UF-70]EDO01133.1 predicted protein [Sclerotinia sclerotiorum 1980 UF-70]